MSHTSQAKGPSRPLRVASTSGKPSQACPGSCFLPVCRLELVDVYLFQCTAAGRAGQTASCRHVWKDPGAGSITRPGPDFLILHSPHRLVCFCPHGADGGRRRGPVVTSASNFLPRVGDIHHGSSPNSSTGPVPGRHSNHPPSAFVIKNWNSSPCHSVNSSPDTWREEQSPEAPHLPKGLCSQDSSMAERRRHRSARKRAAPG